VLVKSIVVFMTLSSYGFDLRSLATGRGRECIWAKYADESAAREIVAEITSEGKEEDF